jgi:hypothetical protein
MEFNQINYKNSHTRYFEKDLETILVDYIKASGITILPLAVRVMIKFLMGGTFKETIQMFFSDRDILIILVSVVSSAAFVTYKYLNRKPLCFICWVCVALSFGAYLNIEHIDTFRGIMWFIISIIFSFSNILASQYIPKERRKDIC